MSRPYPSAELKEICDKYDELYELYLSNPSDKLLKQSRKLDEMKFEHAARLGLVSTRCNFAEPTQHCFTPRHKLLASL